MRFYDVIIIGGGIAGTGLAYNLKKLNYKGSVLVIDKSEVGANKGHYYRNTFEETIREYSLPSCRKLKGVKMGLYNKVYFKIDVDFRIIDYHKACSKLLQNSDAFFSKETALDLKKNTLITDKNSYKFKYLIDCSGAVPFSGNFFNRSASFRYWIGNVRVLKNNLRIREDYFLYLFADNPYCEEVYFLNKVIVHGDWQYTNKIDFNLIKPHKKTFYNRYKKKLDLIEESKAVIPCTPVFPLVYKNIAFLGDSFGNATTASAEGIRPILDSSEILAEAIIKDNILFYEKEWKRRYFDIYYKHLVSRLDLNSNFKLNNILPKYPSKPELFKAIGSNKELALRRLRNDSYKMPIEIMKKFPLTSLLVRQLLYRSYVKLRYSIM